MKFLQTLSQVDSEFCQLWLAGQRKSDGYKKIGLLQELLPARRIV